MFAIQCSNYIFVKTIYRDLNKPIGGLMKTIIFAGVVALALTSMAQGTAPAATTAPAMAAPQTAKAELKKTALLKLNHLDQYFCNLRW